jgi:hypothetical protein
MTKWLKRGDLWRPVHDTDSVLTLIDSPSHYKEDPMDSHTIDIVDDNPASVGPMPSANFAAAAALLLARAREIDASFRLLGVNSSIAALVADMMSPEKLPQQRSLADNPFMKVWLKADEDFRAQQLGTRMRQAIAAEQAVPLSQRCVPGFQRTY